MKQVPLVAMVALMLGLAALALSGVIRNAPAFSPELRREAPHGDWRVADSAALYHQARYSSLIAESHRAGDPARAIAHYGESLAMRPGHASTWAALAEARLGAGDARGAAAALETSRTLAPSSRAMTAQRLKLTSAIAAAGVPPQPTAGLVEDLVTAQRYTRRFYWNLMAEDEALADIAASAGLQITR
ncbi:MAG: tetratricopeptide repeat protein [Pseudomonadota bacterium]